MDIFLLYFISKAPRVDVGALSFRIVKAVHLLFSRLVGEEVALRLRSPMTLVALSFDLRSLLSLLDFSLSPFFSTLELNLVVIRRCAPLPSPS